MHLFNRSRNSRRGTHRRGYSLLEVAAAIAIFGALAGVVTLAVSRAQLTATEMRYERQVRQVIASYVDQVATSEYSQLFDGSFIRPDACASDASKSCASVWGRSFEVEWSTEALADPLGASPDASMAVQLRAATTVNGDEIAVNRTVVAPNAAWMGSDGLLRIRYGGEYTGRLYLMNAAGDGIASANAANGRAVMRAPADQCTTAAPCRLALTPAGRWELDGWGLDAQTALGVRGRVVLNAGSLTDLGARITEAAPLTVLLSARNDAGVSSAPTVAGSVCLWLRFHDGAGTRDVPGCNDVDADRIVFERYAVSNAANAKTLLIPSELTMALSTDSAAGDCPSVAGMLVHRGAQGWLPGAACTSFTWGSPSVVALEGSPLTLGTEFERAGASRITAEWSGVTGRPASGYGAELRWVKPRTAGVCADVAGCAPLTVIPEPTECPAQHCRSEAVVAPSLATPLRGTGGVHSFAIDGDTSAEISFAAVTPDATVSGVTTIALSQIPNGVVVSRTTIVDDEPVTVTFGEGDIIGSYTGTQGSSTVTITTPSGYTHGVFRVLLNGPGGTRTVPVAAGTIRAPWQLATTGTTVRQNGTSEITVRVTASDGELLQGAAVTVTDLPANISATTATTDAEGNASITLIAGALPVQITEFNLTATAAGKTITRAVPLRVTATITTLTVTAGTVGQGATAPVAVTARDAVNAPVTGGVVELDVLDGELPALGVRARPAGCTTGDDGSGTCAATLVADSGAATKNFTLRASAGNVTASTTFGVASTVRRVLFEGGNVRQGGSVELDAEAVDGVGAPMAGVLIVATVTNPRGVSIATQGVTGADGTTTLLLSASANAAKGVRAVTLAAGTSTTSAQISVTSAVRTVAAVVPGIRVGGSGQVAITARDANGELVPLAELGIAVPTGMRAPSTVRTDTIGVARFSVQVPAEFTAGPRQMTVSFEGTALEMFTIQVDYGVTSVLATTALNRTAGTQQLVLRVTSAEGATLANRSVQVSSPFGSVIVTPNCVSAADGSCTVSVTLPRTLPKQIIVLTATSEGRRFEIPVNFR